MMRALQINSQLNCHWKLLINCVDYFFPIAIPVVLLKLLTRPVTMIPLTTPTPKRRAPPISPRTLTCKSGSSEPVADNVKKKENQSYKISFRILKRNDCEICYMGPFK